MGFSRLETLRGCAARLINFAWYLDNVTIAEKDSIPGISETVFLSTGKQKLAAASSQVYHSFKSMLKVESNGERTCTETNRPSAGPDRG